MQKENNRVPPPWGDDMEEALMAQAEAIRTNNIRIDAALARGWLTAIRNDSD
jgi:hypothetical protein